MVDSPHALIEEYMERLRRATLILPGQARAELLTDIAEHLEAGMDGRAGTVVEARNLLDELGSPEQIAAAALDQLPATVDAPPRRGMPPVVSLLLAVAAVLLTWIVWPLGVLCLWLSDVFTTRQKWLGTLVFPGGILILWPALVMVPFRIAEACSWRIQNGHVVDRTCSPPPWAFHLEQDLANAVYAVFILAPIAVAVYLGVVLIRHWTRRSAAAGW